jgi:glycosyltransferase involved in cell wall biosynthesis
MSPKPDSASADPGGFHALSPLWIAWNTHTRTAGLCAAWDLPLRIIRSERPGILGKVEQAIRTLGLLHRHRPGILFIQNPSLALTVLALLTRRWFAFYLVIDAHNEGVRPFDRPGALVGWLTRRALKGADTTIVTNTALAADVSVAGGRPLALSDSLPVPPSLPADAGTAKEMLHIAVIATFRPDEPIAAIMAAAATMPEVRFAFTGDHARFRASGSSLPPNVHLTGYLPAQGYWELLAQAAVICDLSLKPDCLVCGAYEALALGKPMVLSDDRATREVFGSAAILTVNEPHAIANALRAALEQQQTLAARTRALREAYREAWQSQAAAARAELLERVSASRRGAA